MKKILSIFTLVFALMVSANTAYATNSFATLNSDGTYTGTLYAYTTGATMDSWIELNKGAGMVQYGRTTRPAGEFLAQVTGLQCGSSYPYRLGAVNPFTNVVFYGQTYNLQVTCNTTNPGNNNNVSVVTGTYNAGQYNATLNGSVNTSADSWIEANVGNGTQQFGRATRSGSYSGFVSGLQCGYTYYYRAVAQGANGTVYGDLKTFSTNRCNTTVVNNNNLTVSTTGATGVAYTSARLNGIAFVNGTTPTNGYFEYGTSGNLGNRTITRNYFESTAAPLVDTISGLETNTTYYYRAVAQNSNGTAYGEIRSFRTLALGTTPNTNTNTNTTTVRNTTTTNTVRTNTGTNNSGIVYIPVQLAQIGTVGSTNGAIGVPALATSAVVKSGADGCNNTYTITFTNVSDKVLTNVLGTVILPNELAFVSASEGTFRDTDNTLSISIGTLEARSSKTITVTAKVLEGAQVGKQVAVTALLNYTDGTSSAQDQVTGYTILTIDEKCATTVVGTSQAGAAGLFGFLPNSLWQWILVIFAIALIIFAARSLFASKETAK